MARARTTKGLAKRIDLHYFKRLHPMRAARLAASAAAAGAAILLVLGHLARGDDRPYSSGPLAPPHALFDSRCGLCHVPARPGGFLTRVPDEACSGCHEGTVHQATQVSTPPCAGCHVEHEAPAALVSTGDAQCTTCHRRLATSEGPPRRVVPSVTSFSGPGHPEWKPLRAGSRDPGTVRLNHEAHLRRGLPGPGGPVGLACGSCHEADAARRFMRPAAYDRHCKGCHALTFDLYGLFPDGAAAPHAMKPMELHAWLARAFSERLLREPDLWRRPLSPGPARSLPPDIWREPPPPPPRSPEEWLGRRVDEAGRLLLRRSCGLCHALRPGREGSPSEVVEPAIPARWLPLADFAHGPHRFLRCEACHRGAATSQETADVLVPGIATCLECHADAPRRAALGACVTCHRYHLAPPSRGLDGPHALDSLWRTS